MERRMPANCVNKVYWLLLIHLSRYSGDNVLNFQNDLEDLDICLTALRRYLGEFPRWNLLT
jgi:hypothetical protein